MSEKVIYVSLSVLDDKQVTTPLVIQLDGGGASQAFHRGMKAEDAIRNLRYLAELLERGVAERAALPTRGSPDAAG